MQIFSHRILQARGRSSLFVNLKKEFWKGVKPPRSKGYKPQRVIHRVYFFFWKGEIFISFKDPVFMPMCRVYIRRLRDNRVTIPTQLVKKLGLEKGCDLYLTRFAKNYRGLAHKCHFVNLDGKIIKPNIEITELEKELGDL
ncbi:MAG: hypothetical protein FWE38_00035 [Firmicutes bacterium]|nr:hypothetical protein [Bacillota bacterium]